MNTSLSESAGSLDNNPIAAAMSLRRTTNGGSVRYQRSFGFGFIGTELQTNHVRRDDGLDFLCGEFPGSFNVALPAKPSLEVNQEELLTLFVALNEPILCPGGLNDAI
jgi:hypothetical protein